MQAEIGGVVSALFVPGLFIVLALTLVLTARYVISRYKKVPPGRVGIFYGRKYKWADGKERGFMLMSGGGRVQRPVVEEYLEIPTTAFQVPIREEGIPNKDNVKFNVGGVATCKVSTDPADLSNAVEALIDKLSGGGHQTKGGSDNQAVEEFVLNILKGHLRGIIGKLNVDELLRNRDEFNKKVMEESKVELKSLGVDLMSMVIQDINDKEGYIDAMGRRAVADAKAEADIKVSNAEMSSKLIKAENEAKVALANKDRDVKQAQYKVEAETEKAKAEQAFAIANAAQEQTLKVAQADRDAAAATAQVKVQEQEAVRRKKELEATVVAQAEADKRVTILNAEAAKQQKITEAEATAEVLRTTAEAQKNAAVLAGEGESRATKMKLVAKAEGDAAAKEQALLAEARGTKELAEALKQLSDKGQMIIVLDKLPALMKDGGDALAKVAKEVFTGIAAPLGQIDNFNIVEFGSNGHSANGNGNGGGVLERLTNLSPTVIAQGLAALKTMGVDPGALLKAVGIDTSGFNSLFGGLNPAGTTKGSNTEDKTVEQTPPSRPRSSRSTPNTSTGDEAHP